MLPPLPMDFNLVISQVTLAHQQAAKPGYSWDLYRQRRKEWGVVCVLSGTGEYAYSDRTVELLSAGSVALIPPTTAYGFQVPPDCPCCLHCTVNFLADDSFLSMLEPDRLCVFRPADFHHFQQLFQEIVSLWNRKQMGYKMLVMSRLYQLIHDMLHLQMQQKIAPGIWDMVAPAQLYIAEHPQEALRVEALARLCSLSATHFRRLFRQAYGLSPAAYIQGIRLEKAKDLLRVPSCSIAEIAEQCGFSDANYFIRFFKRQMGTTPHQYRRQG